MQPFIELIRKEIYRFMSIWVQTILGPVSTAILYQLVFGQQLASIPTGISGIKYADFLVPGLVMMQIMQNSFGNGSSSLVQSKYSGSVIFVLMAPISPLAIYSAYLISSMIRGIIVGAAVLFSIAWFGMHMPQAWWALFYFLILGCAITAGLGMIAGIISDKFDQLAGFQSFIMVPLIYLAGVFFNPDTLPGFWRDIAYFNPFLYIVDGFRYGFIAHANPNIGFGAIFVLVLAIVVNTIGFLLIKKGIKIKH